MNDTGRNEYRIFGVSNWTHERITEANAYARSKGLEGFIVSSPNFGQAHQIADPWGGGCVTVTGEENEDARQWYTDNQMPVLHEHDQSQTSARQCGGGQSSAQQRGCGVFGK